ncbi:MAG TPA: protein translocase subunit SecD [Steroidobacteraceae bacterium]|nr:protein translocase subunit SecD [Steroidobacteraceae bacterium]
MSQFPRWKSITVAVALILGVLFALPNLFGTDPAVQLAARNYESITPVQERAVEAFLRGKQVGLIDSYLEEGKLAIRFSRVAEQLKARDVISESLAEQYIVALTSAPRTPAVLRAIGMRPMNLGLDLRGGLYLLYQVDVEGAVKQVLDRLEQDFRRTLRDERIPYQSVEAGKGGQPTAQDRDPNAVRITLRDPANLEPARAALAKANRDMTFTVDDSAAAPTLITRLTPQQIKERQDYAIQQNITTMRNRVNELGVSEPIVQRQGLDRINVQLPGVQNSAEVKDILGKTATLEFRLVDTSNDPYEAARRGSAPLGTKLYYTSDKRPVLLKRDVIVTGDQLTDAKSHIDPQEGPAVSVRLDARGAAEMLKTTQANLNRPMAVVFIEKVRRYVNRDGQSVPVDSTEEHVINTATIRGVFSNNFQITGLKLGEAKSLALLLRAGSLAAPLYSIEERAIGPSLGQDNIDRGVRALLVGSLLLFAFMAIYYKAFGWIANLVLTFNVVLLVALLTLLQAALTLPGIAGIVLTVAMAVDANILIYERIREELRNGNSPMAAISAGFDKAFSAITDSNITSLIAGVVLFVLGTGPIKGFAVALCLGILTTLFTALLGSRALINAIYGRRARIERLSI